MRTVIAVGLVTATVLTTGAVGTAQTDSWVGSWKSVDLDGSNQTLTITRRADGAYGVILFDDRAGVCGGIAASGDGVGTVAGNLMTGTTVITCADGRNAGTFPFKGTYNAGNNTFTDGLGVVWSRVPVPKFGPVGSVPLGRLVLNAREAPGLKQRAAKPASAKQALARAIRPRRLPRFAPTQTQVSHFARGQAELWSLAFVMKNAGAARAARKAITRSLGGRQNVVLSHRGRVLGAIVFRAPFGRAGVHAVALGYARLAESIIERAVTKTAWQRALDRIGPNGRITRRAALDLFALAYAPLPGTKLPPGPAGRIHDATIAMRSILQYWSTLTPVQRAAAASLLGVTGVPSAKARSFALASRAAAPLRRAVVGDPFFTEDDALYDIAEKYRALYEQRLGQPLKLQLVVGRTTVKIKGADAFAIDDFGFAFTRFAKYCRIRLGPNLKTLTGDLLQAVVAHEVFHCMQFSMAGPTAWDDRKSGTWAWEGSADWAALRVTQLAWAQVKSPEDYLNTCAEKSLYARTYDAVGYFAHAHDAGVGTFWSRAEATMKATLVSDEAAYDASGGSLDAVLSSGRQAPSSSRSSGSAG